MTVCDAVRPLVVEAMPLLLVEELSHRVINEYSQAVAALRLGAARASTAEARAELMSVAARICDFADAHRALQVPMHGGDVDLAGYLTSLCSALTKAMLKERGIMLSLTAEPVMLPAGRCWRVALVIAELINNAVRHGVREGGGAILIRLEQFGDKIACHVIDNGGVNKTPIPSRGISVVRRLMSELSGNARWVFGKNGTRVEMSFPVALMEARS